MTIQIQIIATNVETKPTAKGSYQQLEVTYKNLTFQNKVESKKLMSFGANATAFKTLSTAQAGQVYTVEVVKNAQGYNDWPSVTAGAVIQEPTKPQADVQKAPIKTTYETPEERAQRQILIVRQSSLSSAVSLLTTAVKTPPKPSDVIAVAKEFETYVFGLDVAAASGGATGFDDLPDFDEQIK